jgi:hypothetical protein
MDIPCAIAYTAMLQRQCNRVGVCVCVCVCVCERRVNFLRDYALHPIYALCAKHTQTPSGDNTKSCSSVIYVCANIIHYMGTYSSIVDWSARSYNEPKSCTLPQTCNIVLLVFASTLIAANLNV